MKALTLWALCRASQMAFQELTHMGPEVADCLNNHPGIVKIDKWGTDRHSDEGQENGLHQSLPEYNRYNNTSSLFFGEDCHGKLAEIWVKVCEVCVGQFDCDHYLVCEDMLCNSVETCQNTVS
jgi:hypothetical protein